MGEWPIILPILAVGIVIGKVLPPIRRWFELNQLLASAERLGRRDHISLQEGCSPQVVAAKPIRVMQRSGRSATTRVVARSARIFQEVPR